MALVPMRPPIHNEYYTEETHTPYELFDLGDFPPEEGGQLRGCKLAYKTLGTLNAAKDNAVLFPHMYSGTHMDMEIYIGEGLALDPQPVLHHPARPDRRRRVDVTAQHTAPRRGSRCSASSKKINRQSTITLRSC